MQFNEWLDDYTAACLIGVYTDESAVVDWTHIELNPWAGVGSMNNQISCDDGHGDHKGDFYWY